jgi:hypothetical protein
MRTTTKKTKAAKASTPRSKKPPPKKNKIERWIIVPDLHSSVNGEHDPNGLCTVEYKFVASHTLDGYLVVHFHHGLYCNNHHAKKTVQ